MTSRTLNVRRYAFVPLLLLLELGCVAEAPRAPDESVVPPARAAQPKAPPPPAHERPDEAPPESGTAELGAECPPGAPFFCRTECSPSPCPATCDRTGCPSAFVCKDCGDGIACVPAGAC